jgi:protein-L-isoaspartate(D-aspartate) O-methyltransferase
MDLARSRKHMIDSQIRVNDVHEPLLLAAIAKVRREDLCAEEHKGLAYAEYEPIIGPERYLMKSRESARLLQALSPKSGERALCLAAPFGAMVLNQLGLHVVAQEECARTMTILQPAFTEAKIESYVQSLAEPVGDQYDLILIEGAVHYLPDTWSTALKPGGRIGLIFVHEGSKQARLYHRLGQSSDLSSVILFDASARTLKGFEPKHNFVL